MTMTGVHIAVFVVECVRSEERYYFIFVWGEVVSFSDSENCKSVRQVVDGF